jgi:hypothetical protein
MYNYDNEYTQPEFETNYEFNPQTGSNYEMENFQNESGFNNEYAIDPEFEMEGDYEYENEFEDQPQFEMDNEWENETIVRDHSTRPAITVPTARGASSYPPRSTSYYRPPSSVGYRPSGTYRPPYRPATNWYNRYRAPYGTGTNSYNRYRTPYGYSNTNWYNRYRPPYGSQGQPWWRRRYPYYTPTSLGSDIGTPSQQLPQDTTGSMQQQPPQDSSFKNYILETLKNLSAQVAAIANKDQQGPGTMEPPPTSPSLTTPPQEAPASSSEFEMEDYEYNMENEGEVMDSEGIFNEVTETELASELLGINNEMELDHFLGDLFKQAVGGISGILSGPQGKILKSLLKNVVKKALPIAGTAAGAYFGGPLGAQAGGNIANAAAGMFELELEGLSNEDSEFEIAKAVVRLSGNAARQLADQNTGDPKEDARHALIQASSRYAPGLIAKKDNGYNAYGNKSYGNDYTDGYGGGAGRRR